MAMAKRTSLRLGEARQSPTTTGLSGKSYLDLAAALDTVPKQPPKPKKPTRAERKERRRKSRIERKKKFFRDYLRQELELSKRSDKIGRHTWLEMCEKIKMTELRVELQEWEQKAQDTLVRKDKNIEGLLEELEQAEEMQKRQFERQVQLMDYIIGCYRSVLKCMKILYEQEAAKLVEDFYNELNSNKDIYGDMQLHSENVMHTTNLLLEQHMVSDFQIYHERLDDCVNLEILKRYQLRDSIAAKMKSLRKQLLGFMASLRNPIIDKGKFEEIAMLMERQHNYVFEAHRLNDIEFHCNRQTTMLQRDLLGIEVNAQRNINDLNLEMAYFMHVRKSIEQEIELDRQQKMDQMKIFCCESYMVIQKYTKIQKYGELLLGLSAQCRRLESESEKIVPWGDFPELMHKEALEVEAIKLNTLDMEQHVDVSEQEMADDENQLKNFRRKLYLVNMHCLQLQAEKRILTVENARYVDIIKSMSQARNHDKLSQAINITCLKEVKLPPCPQLKRKNTRQINFE